MLNKIQKETMTNFREWAKTVSISRIKIESVPAEYQKLVKVYQDYRANDEDDRPCSFCHENAMGRVVRYVEKNIGKPEQQPEATTDGMWTNKLGFEIESCSRCGGSGQYSYCQAYGTTCFKCGGTGRQMTRKGSAASEFFRSSMNLPVSDLKVGYFIKSNGWRKVLEISPDKLNEGYVSIKTQKICIGYTEDSVLTCVRDEDHRQKLLAEALEYQGKLTKAGKLMKKHQD